VDNYYEKINKIIANACFNLKSRSMWSAPFSFERRYCYDHWYPVRTRRVNPKAQDHTHQTGQGRLWNCTIKVKIANHLKLAILFTSLSQIFETFKFLRIETKEYFLSLHLVGKYRIIANDVCSVGSLDPINCWFQFLLRSQMNLRAPRKSHGIRERGTSNIPYFLRILNRSHIQKLSLQ